MRCIYFDKELKYIEDYKKPARSENEVLIKVILAAICNTDKEIIRGYKDFKGILGHEFVGIIEDADDKNVIGKRVTGDINIGCDECDFCKAGYPNHCKSRRVLGITNKDGAFAEYITLPVKNIYFINENISDYEAVFTEPLAAALEISEKSHIKPSDRVAIVGNGKLGQLIGQVISLTGCDLTVIGRKQKKLALLKNRARIALISEANYENYFDVVIECTGNVEGLEYAKKIVKAMGKIVLKSTYSADANLNPTSWVVNEITLIGSRCGPIDAALRLLERGLVNTKPLISGIYLLKDYEKAFSEGNSLKNIFKIQE